MGCSSHGFSTRCFLDRAFPEYASRAGDLRRLSRIMILAATHSLRRSRYFRRELIPAAGGPIQSRFPALKRLVSRPGLAIKQRPRAPVIRVATFKDGHLGALDFDDPVGERGQKRAVVRGNDAGRCMRSETGFEPFARRDVEMIGGLVQDQQVRLHGERAGQPGTGTFAAGQRSARRDRNPAVE